MPLPLPWAPSGTAAFGRQLRDEKGAGTTCVPAPLGSGRQQAPALRLTTDGVVAAGGSSSVQRMSVTAR
ncbi:hypothetical protein GCM10010532_091330 [Dactylosporangium siamense]